MRIKGKLVTEFFSNGSYLKKYEDVIAEIELPPVDTSKLKVEDEVLVRLKITEAKALCSCLITAVDSEKDYISIYTKDIVAHIPQPEEPKKVDMPEKWDEFQKKAAQQGIISRVDIMEKQNQIIDCLRELKEKEEKL